MELWLLLIAAGSLVVGYLADWWRRRPGWVEVASPPPDTRVFHSRHGPALSPEAIIDDFARATGITRGSSRRGKVAAALSARQLDSPGRWEVAVEYREAPCRT